MATDRPLIRDVPPAEMGPLLRSLGQPAYRGSQLALWLHRARALAWDEMTDLPLPLRRQLAERFDLQGLAPQQRLVAGDDTRKFLFRLRDGEAVESVIIPMERHVTFCLSSQVGCAMACRFCATARGGLARNLSAAEIVEQVIHLERDLAADPLPGGRGRAYNIVFMGMGEPLDNWEQVSAALDVLVGEAGCGISARRVTVSTSGGRSGLQDLLKCDHPVGLTLSVNAAGAALRRRLMPVPGRTPLPQLLEMAARHARRIHRDVTLSYVLIAGRNDDLSEARELAALVGRRPFKVNLIPYNSVDDDRLAPSPPARVLEFQRALVGAGIRTMIRISGGQDIAAACGQLRGRRLRAQGATEPDRDEGKC